MKAITFSEYGPPQALRLRMIDLPKIGSSDVLVRVHAASLHRGDCFTVRGAPFPVRAASGWIRPTVGIPGYDFAGHIVAKRSGVTDFEIGDEVFGASQGTCAEFVTAAVESIATKPSHLTFEEAAAIPTSASAALHGLRDVGRMKHGQDVLIIGASGGVGSFAVQIAKAAGAIVTGICSSASAEFVASLGADEIIDYTHEDFTKNGRRYDLIFDNVETSSLTDLRRLLKPHGTLILNSGTGASGMKFYLRLLKPLVLSPVVKQDLRRFISVPRRAELELLRDLCADSLLRPPISRVYELGDTAAALAYIESGHARGKVVVKVS